MAHPVDQNAAGVVISNRCVSRGRVRPLTFGILQTISAKVVCRSQVTNSSQMETSLLITESECDTLQANLQIKQTEKAFRFGNNCAEARTQSLNMIISAHNKGGELNGCRIPSYNIFRQFFLM